jgi:hypothetical protein
MPSRERVDGKAGTVGQVQIEVKAETLPSAI